MAVVLLALAVTAPAYAKSKRTKRSSARIAKVAAAIVNPNDGAVISGRIEWRATASSPAGIRSVRFYVDGALRVTDTISPYTYVKDTGALDTSKLANGKHVLKIVATAGNQPSRSDSHTVTVNNGGVVVTPPPVVDPPPPDVPDADGEPTTPTTTPPDTSAPSAPFNLAASVSATSAAISWSASTDNVGVDHYDVSVDGLKRGSAAVSPYTVAVSCGTTSSVTVTAVDLAGNSSTGGPLSVTTSSCADTAAPSAPTGLSAAAITQTSATLTWNASTDNVGVERYRVYSGATELANVTSTSSPVALSCSTSRSFTVRAFDAAGNASAVSSTLSVNALACPDTSAPSVPANLVSSATTQTSATLTWSASTDNLGVARYDVYNGGALLRSVTGATSTSVPLTCGVASSFTVRALDAAGNASAESTARSITGSACVDTTPPTAPTNIAATSITQTSASITWSPSSDETAIASYDIYRNGAWIDWSMNSPYSMTGLTCGTSYAAGVVSLDTSDNHATGVPVSFTTSACSTPVADTTAPSVPSSLSSSGVTQTGATLAWGASTDSAGVTGYRINQNGSFLKSVSGGTSTSVSLTCAVSSAFTVQAFDAAGNTSSASSSLSITGAACSSGGDTTPPSAPNGLASSSVTQTGATVTWAASTDDVGVTSYRVNRNGSQAGSTTGAVRTYSFSDLTCGNSYSITITALDAAGNSSTSSPLNVTASACSTGGATPPSLPGNWSLNFSDEFNGTSLDSRWCTSWFNGGTMNQVPTSPANVSVTGGNLLLQRSDSAGSLINTNPNDCGKTGYTFTTGYYAEARVYFPGNGTQIYNWPAWWTNGQNWPNNGEIDIAEGLGVMSSNYHSPAGANNYFPSGVWSNAYHNYAVLRENGMNYIYFDGTLIRSYASNDGGSPHYLIFNQGGSGVTGAASQVRVDWVRVWKK